MKPWQTPAFKRLLQLALAEDLDSGDVTSDALISDDSISDAEITSKSRCVIAGQWVAHAVFREIDPAVQYSVIIEDGHLVEKGQTLATLSGATRSILAGERLALNFLQRLSGIATATREMIELANNPACRIVDTRKTVPGMRLLDKYAVKAGGGGNHRTHLGDGVLIKDNHIKACKGITNAVRKARASIPHTLKIQVEVTTLAEVEEAVRTGVDALLLDNMEPVLVRQIADRFGRVILLECSGNLTRDRIHDYATTGVHILSIGALTHSVKAADISLNFR